MMTEVATAKSSALRRWMPLVGLVLAVALVFATGLHRYLSFETLRDHRESLLRLVADHRILAPLAFVGLYAVAIALSIPGGAILTMAGGFLFGTWLGGLCAVVGATVGATAVFLIARSALGGLLKQKAGPWLQRMEAGFRENALNYLIVLRLIPIFPFWLINLVPAFLDVRLGTYMLATFVGIIPGSVVFAGAGNGLGAVFDQGQTPDLSLMFQPQILGPILGLAFLAILPVVYRRWRARSAE